MGRNLNVTGICPTKKSVLSVFYPPGMKRTSRAVIFISPWFCERNTLA